MAHTPGPWRVSQPSGNYIDTPTHSIAALMYGATKEDAALIAAAPDMLAALEDAHDQLSAWADYADGEISDEDNAALKKIWTAISKAKGE